MINASTIKILRNRLDINQSEFCNYLSIKQPYLAMIERYSRDIPPAVKQRLSWMSDDADKNLASFEKSKNKQILSNKVSIDFAWKTLKTKKFDLKTAEMDLTILLRLNIEHTRRIYLLEKMRPMPGLKRTSLQVFIALKKLHVRRAGEKLESAGPKAILEQKMKIAALRAEIQYLEEHLDIAGAVVKRPVASKV